MEFSFWDPDHEDYQVLLFDEEEDGEYEYKDEDEDAAYEPPFKPSVGAFLSGFGEL